MCIFCAAIPAATSIGAAITVKQNDKRREAEARGETAKVNLPPGKITAVVVAGLVVSAAVYHSVIMPHTGG